MGGRRRDGAGCGQQLLAVAPAGGLLGDVGLVDHPGVGGLELVLDHPGLEHATAPAAVQLRLLAWVVAGRGDLLAGGEAVVPSWASVSWAPPQIRQVVAGNLVLLWCALAKGPRAARSQESIRFGAERDAGRPTGFAAGHRCATFAAAPRGAVW